MNPTLQELVDKMRAYELSAAEQAARQSDYDQAAAAAAAAAAVVKEREAALLAAAELARTLEAELTQLVDAHQPAAPVLVATVATPLPSG